MQASKRTVTDISANDDEVVISFEAERPQNPKRAPMPEGDQS